MKRIVTMAAAVLVLSACSSSGKSATPTDSGATGTTIRIQGFGFHPSPLTVSPGATVTVNTLDSSTHTVTSKQAGAFNTSDIDGNGTVTFTAPTTPGTYSYVCAIHSTMHGTLIVK